MKLFNKNKIILILTIMLALVITGCQEETINREETPNITSNKPQEQNNQSNNKVNKEELIGQIKDVLKPIGENALKEGKLTLDGIIDKIDNEKDSIVNNNQTTTTPEGWTKSTIENLGLQNHKEIQVDGGDTSGQRQPLVKVNVGFGDRDYWGFTNEHGQLIHVIAEEIILQDDDNEPVNSSGRYYNRMADVPGTEDKTYDRGHVIADSLGGTSNAYNITPQHFYLNRHGDQAYMENNIRKAGGASQFIATIEYPNTQTQIPTNYKIDYVLKGNLANDSFPNADPR